MLNIIFIIITTVHGLVHLMGFMKAFNLAKIPQLTANINKPVGVAWLAAFALFYFQAVCLLLKRNGGGCLLLLLLFFRKF